MQTQTKTVFETFLQRDKEEMVKLEKALKEADKKEKEIIKKLEPLREKQLEDNEKLNKLRDEYWKILHDLSPDIEKEIRANSITMVDVDSGKNSMRQFLDKGKNEAEIKKEIKVIARKRAEKIAPVVRELRKEMYIRENQIKSLEADLAGWQGNPMLNRKSYLENSLKDINNRLNSNMGQEIGSDKEQAGIDCQLATSGSYQTKIFYATGIQDIHFLQLNPIVQSKHFEELSQVIAEIEKIPDIDKTPITVYYNQNSDHPNFGKSHFRYVIRNWGGK